MTTNSSVCTTVSYDESWWCIWFYPCSNFFLGIIFKVKLPLFWLIVISLFNPQVPYSNQYHGLMPSNRSVSFNLESRWNQLANTLAAYWETFMIPDLVLGHRYWFSPRLMYLFTILTEWLLSWIPSAPICPLLSYSLWLHYSCLVIENILLIFIIFWRKPQCEVSSITILL